MNNSPKIVVSSYRRVEAKLYEHHYKALRAISVDLELDVQDLLRAMIYALLKHYRDQEGALPISANRQSIKDALYLSGYTDERI